MLSRDSEDKMWSRFVIWPQEVTLAIWIQPSGPLCLWQCFYLHPTLHGQHFLELRLLTHLLLLGCQRHSLKYLNNWIECKDSMKLNIDKWRWKWCHYPQKSDKSCRKVETRGNSPTALISLRRSYPVGFYGGAAEAMLLLVAHSSNLW